MPRITITVKGIIRRLKEVGIAEDTTRAFIGLVDRDKSHTLTANIPPVTIHLSKTRIPGFYSIQIER